MVLNNKILKSIKNTTFMIIGLTGKNAAGKGTVASYLEKKGFIYNSLSDELRIEAKNKNINPTRENLIKLGNELRKKFGSNYLVLKIANKIKEENPKIINYVIDSIRNPAEITELKRIRGFFLIGIDAEVSIRYKRTLQRAREGDITTIQNFIKLEEKENFNKKSNQQLDKCLQMADNIITNNGTLEELYEKIDALLKNMRC